MSFNIADITDFLTPGAVFHREDGSSSRVLFLTNTSLPKKVREKFPPQVVYADENDNVLSNSVENFLAKRKFFNGDPELETRLNNLLAFSSTDNEILDLGDDEDLLLLDDNGDGPDLGGGTDDEDDEDAAFDLQAPSEAKDIAAGQYGVEDIDERETIVTFTVNNPELPQVLSPELLTEAVESYQQQPSADLMSVQHVLFIKALSNINADSLDAAFSPAAASRNQTLEFAVDLNGDGSPTNIDWTTFIGVYPCVFYGSRMFQVIFSSPIVPADIAAAVSAVVAEAAPALNAAIEQAEVTAPAVAAVASDIPAVIIANPAAVVQAAPAPAPVQVQVAPAPQAVQAQVQPQNAMQQAMAAATSAQ